MLARETTVAILGKDTDFNKAVEANPFRSYKDFAKFLTKTCNHHRYLAFVVDAKRPADEIRECLNGLLKSKGVNIILVIGDDLKQIVDSVEHGNILITQLENLSSLSWKNLDGVKEFSKNIMKTLISFSYPNLIKSV